MAKIGNLVGQAAAKARIKATVNPSPALSSYKGLVPAKKSVGATLKGEDIEEKNETGMGIAGKAILKRLAQKSPSRIAGKVGKTLGRAVQDIGSDVANMMPKRQRDQIHGMLGKG